MRCPLMSQSRFLFFLFFLRPCLSFCLSFCLLLFFFFGLVFLLGCCSSSFSLSDLFIPGPRAASPRRVSPTLIFTCPGMPTTQVGPFYCGAPPRSNLGPAIKKRKKPKKRTPSVRFAGASGRPGGPRLEWSCALLPSNLPLWSCLLVVRLFPCFFCSQIARAFAFFFPFRFESCELFFQAAPGFSEVGKSLS